MQPGTVAGSHSLSPVRATCQVPLRLNDWIPAASAKRVKLETMIIAAATKKNFLQVRFNMGIDANEAAGQVRELLFENCSPEKMARLWDDIRGQCPKLVGMARCAIRAGLRRNEQYKWCIRFNRFRRLTLRSATGSIAARCPYQVQIRTLPILCGI
jgi:hypothetical protein